ncbi:MAG: glycosyltransferase [Alphaproteobacteria bacterium]|nr:glycosyltransferase [Alphaproteobacteria bacterium]
MNIVFIGPPAVVINGGIKCYYRMAESLIEAGHEVTVFEQEGRRPTWFSTNVPVIGQGYLVPNPDQCFILPEDQPQLLASVKNWPQKKIVYSQNHFYGALGIGESSGYAEYGVTHILCSSKTIYDHATLRHPELKAYVIPCAIDKNVFHPMPKQKRISYIPRKRALEAIYIRDMFRFLYPEYRDWDWEIIKDKTEMETARLLGESSVFLSLSRLEGFGMTPLEAMSAGCVVAGFTGVGGREYAKPENGFWADEDDFPICLSQLKRAIDMASSGKDSETLALYHEACQKTLASYTPETFKTAVLKAWEDIIHGSN